MLRLQFFGLEPKKGKIIGTNGLRARNSGCLIDRSRRNPAHASSFVLADPLICSEQSMQLQLLAANYTRDLIYYKRKIIHNSRYRLDSNYCFHLNYPILAFECLVIFKENSKMSIYLYQTLLHPLKYVKKILFKTN